MRRSSTVPGLHILRGWQTGSCLVPALAARLGEARLQFERPPMGRLRFRGPAE
ncbi:MAG: hypothetical protein HY303_13395 [Candidatus Wallbacteria bacterium]|nr:hypothetical protein [Candidatus Wallbacteria bacterium]